MPGSMSRTRRRGEHGRDARPDRRGALPWLTAAGQDIGWSTKRHLRRGEPGVRHAGPDHRPAGGDRRGAGAPGKGQGGAVRGLARDPVRDPGRQSRLLARWRVGLAGQRPARARLAPRRVASHRSGGSHRRTTTRGPWSFPRSTGTASTAGTATIRTGGRITATRSLPVPPPVIIGRPGQAEARPPIAQAILSRGRGATRSPPNAPG